MQEPTNVSMEVANNSVANDIVGMLIFIHEHETTTQESRIQLGRWRPVL